MRRDFCLRRRIFEATKETYKYVRSTEEQKNDDVLSKKIKHQRAHSSVG